MAKRYMRALSMWKLYRAETVWMDNFWCGSVFAGIEDAVHSPKHINTGAALGSETRVAWAVSAHHEAIPSTKAAFAQFKDVSAYYAVGTVDFDVHSNLTTGGDTVVVSVEGPSASQPVVSTAQTGMIKYFRRNQR